MPAAPADHAASCADHAPPHPRACACGADEGSDFSSPLETDGTRAHIRRVPADLMSRERWLDEFYRFGRPVVVTGFGTSWPIWEAERTGELDALPFKHWGPGSEALQSRRSIVVDEERGKVHEEPDTSMDQKAQTLARAKRQSTSTDGKLNFTGEYEFFASVMPREPLKGLLGRVPKFLAGEDEVLQTDAAFYAGGRGLGSERHQDFHSCLVAWQLQLRGIKQWRVQMPLNKFAVRVWAEYAFADDLVGQDGERPVWPDTLVYDFEVQPGDLLVWHPQWYHNTTVVSDQDSIALVNHIPTDQIDRSSMFYDTFWVSTRCNENIAGIYGNCWSQWFGRPKRNRGAASSPGPGRTPITDGRARVKRWLEDSRLGEL